MKNSWKELTIGEYDAIRVVLNSSKEDSEKDLEILSILSGESIEAIRGLSCDVVSKMIDEASFLRRAVVVDDVDSFNYGGYEFSTRGIGKISYGQLIDIEHSDGSYVGILRCILVPIGHKYGDGYDIDFSGLSFKVAKGVIDSFLNGLMDSTRRTVKSTLIKLRMKSLIWKGSAQLVNLLKSIQHSLSCMQFRV